VSYSVSQGNTSHRATLQHGDSERDLCQMQVPQMKSPPAAVQAELPVIGQRVYALGAPRGLEATLTDGLVSAIRRHAAGQVDFIQTSAPLSPGSSGGGLFDDQARLVGITTSGVDGAAQNLNFARPAGMIADVPGRSAAELKRWQEKQAVQGVAAPSGASSTAASGYAAIDDLDAVPYLSANGRLGYGRFLERPTPRAFALAPNGAWGYADGFKPSDATLPTDPIERALRVCAKRSTECRLYAVNRAVIWTPPPPPTGSSLKVRKIPTLRDGASP
jgi:serine protease Do